ncbi:cyanase [Allosaccharopolyspora coralli]|uniref:Cyanate hydratase n=1 Tax=Allosaccharopolyspora coralli TaxID=2665642 RepID=A0A5Q3Q6Z3_9PSEU|nr:cyanase [Allosaccharopolyspora coralli]QGK70431.1 cyanase [Allosaccharopolyspora coralli]
MRRSEATEAVLEAKQAKNLSFSGIADELGTDRVWTTAALLGQHPFDDGTATRLRTLLDLPEEAVAALSEIPTRGSLDRLPPTDPTLYRLYEVLQVYGPALKELIHEDFGDGIMSAITFRADVQRVDAEEGPRVQITLDGKFLPYKW